MENNSQRKSHRRGGSLTGILVVVGFIGSYFAMQLWILPAMGVPT